MFFCIVLQMFLYPLQVTTSNNDKRTTLHCLAWCLSPFDSKKQKYKPQITYFK